MPKTSNQAIAHPNLLDSELADSMGYLVRRTFRSFTHSLEERLAGYDISISMWFFLRSLWEGDGKTQKELSEELDLTQPTTVAAMDNLARRGLIRRKRNSVDRRKVNIYLTKAGVELRGSLVGFAKEVNAIALQGLSPAEVELVRQALTKMNDSLASAAAKSKE
jgi:DNA-binding MarR family transcriptional regulator